MRRNLLLVSSLVLGSWHAAAGDVIFVDAAAVGANDGTSWSDAFVDLQEGLSAATAGDEVWVAAATYVPSQTGDRDASFSLVSGVELYGGFAGFETDRSQRDPALFDSTILSGDLFNDDLPGFLNNTENSNQVVTAVAVSPFTILDGFLVSGGNATTGVRRGGGMRVVSGRPEVRNCTFVANSAENQGGGVSLDGASVVLFEFCSFVGNRSVLSAGGALSNEQAVRLVSCSFSGNVARFGGAVRCETGSTTECVDCVFESNMTDGTSLGGGAVYAVGSVITTRFMNCVFLRNTAPQGGACYFDEGGIYTITNCQHAG